MFTEFNDKIQLSKKAYTPYANISNREAWNSIAEEVRSLIISEGEKHLGFNYPQIPITLFLDFKRTGNRVRFEDVYFARRYAINALILAECVEDKGRFMDDILNGIYAICEESAWQLPCHNSYERSSPQETLPDVTDPVLDLFACETGALLAVAMYLLRDRFNAISPFICKMINDALHKRIIKPYFDRHFWWMGNGDEPMCNWTVWCVQNTLLTIFLADDVSDEVKLATVKKAAYSIDCFLKDYGEDGCCSEGAQYYRHAGLCLFNCMEVLNAVTDNAFSPLYENEKIKNIALYIYNVHVEDKYFFNFADCSPVAGRAGTREFLFGKRINSMGLMAFAASDYRANEFKLLNKEINLFYHVQHVFTIREMTEFLTAAPDNALAADYRDIFYESNGLFITKNPTYALAVKAGDNADSHNHNDVGSFTLYKNGLPYIIDVGVESYTGKTFSAQRYEIWTMQSQYHNVPTFGSSMQKDGKSYAAKVLELKEGSIAMDIAGAYLANTPDEKVDSYTRYAMLNAEGVQIKDSYDRLPANSFMTLMTYNKPVITSSSEGEIIVDVENIGEIRIIGATDTIFEVIPINDPRLMQAWEHEVYRIKIMLGNHGLEININ